jgi:hypothetical protein
MRGFAPDAKGFALLLNWFEEMTSKRNDLVFAGDGSIF